MNRNCTNWWQCLFAVLLALWPLTTLAGPPFVTDDPEPVEFQHWEAYLASQLDHDAAGWSGTSPHVEVNYGIVSNLQLHLIAPLEFSAPEHGPQNFGYGDTELGAKYRFLEETTYLPAIGVFPLLEAPTGDHTRALGTGHLDAFLPVWLQKDWGADKRQWTTYGGGGYWINPGAGNRNWWFCGGLLQRQVTDKLTIGMECFHDTANERNGESGTWLNPGIIFDLSETYHLMVSAGHTVQGSPAFQSYVAFQLTFGPAK